ncbi:MULTISPECIES: DEAD/DEAH box helicase [unclassified Tolypothrix]|uniref:DEAD/DEAH box helicase n=1 Tax=unclassified Tolypothrix TaxID=2649714 RepID=UPI0005EAA721|nr:MULTISPECIES: DEAD/DEAH box helicase [unclassified Tolypothrix]BAY95863.1 SNF2-related protein [Microchaete diplosiphon NIES-3275]EKE96695.1 SWI/SNF family helicase [Tolypothrix sp. PCC 7601]MBE9083111.1 DEAD/DEAH box helicase [Tolypothrix sp. LEGE 11397]UYD30831.1 DEAD/DEAH box helicase [Tolypothrix sp. PCC 7712]UYD38759.1 DEAD/DEAH box helicase [Tolypothrix sp. PCC 7601]
MITMNDSEADHQELQTQLAQAYRQLPPLEEKIVQLFSVIYEPINRTSFLECFNYIGARDKNYKSFTNPTLKPYIDGLLAAGLLVQEHGQGPQCHPLLVEIATRSAVKAGCFEYMVKAVHNKLGVKARWQDGPVYFQRESQFIREVRIGLYSHNLSFINKQIEDYNRYNNSKDKISIENIFEQICTNPFDADWFRTLPPELYDNCISIILINAALLCSPADETFTLLQEECATGGEHSSDYLHLILTEQLLLRGCIQEAQQSLECISEDYQAEAAVYKGWLNFLLGDNQQAIADYTAGLKSLKKATGKRQVYFSTMGGLFFILALIKDGSRDSLQEALDYTSLLARQSDHWLRSIYAQLKILLQVQLGDIAQKEFIISNRILFPEEHNSLETLFFALCHYWVDADRAKKHLPRLLEEFYQQAVASGYHWLAMESAELLSRLKPNSSYETQAEILREDIGIDSIVDVMQPQEPWEMCLNALANLQKEPPAPVKAQTELRLAWFITFYPSKCILQPREQKVNAKGEWSKGRPIAIKRLSGNLGELDYLTSQDLRVCGCIETFTSYDYGYRGKVEYTFSAKAISALIGHPLVFWEDAPTTRVEIVKGEPELIVKKGKRDRLTLEFSPKLEPSQNIFTIKETPTRIKVIEITAEHRRIAEIIGKENRLLVPATAEKQVLAAINAVSGIVTVHSDIGGGLEGAEEVPAQTIPHIHLLPANAGLKVSLLSRPFAQGGPYYRPGTGGETVIAEIEGKRLQTRRNLQEEKQLANAAINACPTLTQAEEQDREWLLEDPEDCLELLLELQALGDTVVLEWPEGEKLRVKHQADLKDFQMSIQRQQDWFAATGELKLDKDLVLDMQQLLELLDKTPSRFIPLGDGQFLALTQAFRKRLDELRSFSEKHSKGIRFHPLATLGLEDFVDEVGKVKADKHWKAHIQRLKEVQSLQPELPSTFQAELRDYQMEGFNWMARLAHWGVGACLADQMGLGKTVQALAVILIRAHEGPTLIIAPTSVCMNWVSEAQKFAPTLNIVQFGGANRQNLLSALQPFDMLVCSYGLLQQEEVSQMLSQVQWQTIVLDEAQAIKNMTTKRSQAAMNLKGSFKLITTGTPIENHLGELWNLFRFINPGLLGSFESFNQRFAIPIEKFQDKLVRNKLKKLIQPFLLRRLKNQVLEELPSRTEILLHVELSREEMAFYEALRREAISKLTDSDATAGHKHLQVLAEIMRLRRACCNPSLVMPDTELSSAKLQLFAEVLGDLLENRHKALVFSQFVDHLHIIRNYLDKQGINYQYLDGSTPAPERKKRVDAFQAGSGDVFLISLKAGGTGLNLTAADYVIHMDPWWNPAVEDQASDRAHRIGQQRPVTIYRLVAKDTIEDKIVDLHHHKRDLADSLLEGTDISGKISTEALLELIGV